MTAELAATDVRQATAWDRRIGAELRRCRELGRLSRGAVVEHVPGLSVPTLQTIEEGGQRIPFGTLVAICSAIGLSVKSLLVRAGAIEQDGSLESWLASDPRLDELGREIVLDAYRLAVRQTAHRAGQLSDVAPPATDER